ncbi:DUF423 domain-containing protein [Salisediminibacterium beveridgei]|uniref:DUF423 domain-containing protein n=1 Tax=Salisediminibacterium beveridgei TaxID=632773 RepID=UPI000A00B2E2|nr:DUF423 domain-containing protein [Salisediminibacterium beveridgei]
MKLFLMLAGVSGFLFVALGAFGAHALNDKLEAMGYKATFETGVQYHMVHTLALVAVAILMSHLSTTGLLTASGWAFIVGIILFSGSLYTLSLTGIRIFGAITPLGGVAFLAGWILLVVAAVMD